MTQDSDFGSDTEDKLDGTAERTSSQHNKSLKKDISEAKVVANEIQVSPLTVNSSGVLQNIVVP